MKINTNEVDIPYLKYLGRTVLCFGVFQILEYFHVYVCKLGLCIKQLSLILDFRYTYIYPRAISCVSIYSYILMQYLEMGPRSKMRFNLFITEINS